MNFAKGLFFGLLFSSIGYSAGVELQFALQAKTVDEKIYSIKQGEDGKVCYSVADINGKVITRESCKVPQVTDDRPRDGEIKIEIESVMTIFLSGSIEGAVPQLALENIEGRLDLTPVLTGITTPKRNRK